jgi:hypothetical protein
MLSCPNYRDLERCYGVTWHELVEREPRLAELLWQARQAYARCRRWADVDREFPPINLALQKLIGFSGKNRWHPVLGSVGAYEVAYWKLYDAVAGLLPVRSAAAEEMAEMRQEDTTPESRCTTSDPSRDTVAFAGSEPF